MILRSGAPRVDTSTFDPSDVNFRRLAPRTSAPKFATVFEATSISVIVPSCAFAAQMVLPSGDKSKPSTRPPAGTVVAAQLGRGPLRFSKIVTVPEPTFVVTNRERSANA